MTTSPSLDEFKRVVREEFRYLQSEFGLQEQPRALHEPGNPFEVRFANATTLVRIEGVQWGYGTQVLLGPADHADDVLLMAPLWAVLKHRRPDVYARSSQAFGQLDEVRFYARALREVAADVLRGDLAILAPARALALASVSETDRLEDDHRAASMKAAEAFRAGDFHEVIELLVPFESRLLRSEAARLRIARIRLA